MISTNVLAEAYARNVRIVKLQAEGLSQADSLLEGARHLSGKAATLASTFSLLC